MSTTDQIPPDSPEIKLGPPSKGWIVFVVIAGVVLPAGAVAVELATRMCSFLFDPIPTWWHCALLLIVPASNLVVLLASRKVGWRYLPVLSFLTGVAIGVSFVYSLQFLPSLPIFVMGILAFGLGLLGLSPFLALWASILASRRVSRLYIGSDRRRKRALWAGIALPVILLGVFIFTNWITCMGVRMAASNDEATSLRGVRLIRTLGSRYALLRACYQLPTRAWANVFARDLSEQPIGRDQARAIYYRVTGDSFNSVPAPRLFGARSKWVSDADFDSDVGGTAVNSIARDLALSSSRMDATVDPDALTAYTEWTMAFTNSSADQREARAEIALPPGGVVSRLTLWVNDEEREAAFSSRGKVRAAYQEIAVVRRRDPVLVTTCGPDRILMQCYPVPRNGGTMKIRIGITSPLQPQGYSKSLFTLPRFIERNFGVGDGVKHALFVESSRTIGFGGSAGATVLRQSVSDADIAATSGLITCARDPQVRSVWAPDKLDPKRYAIVQNLQYIDSKPPKNMVVVIDGSARMAVQSSEIAQGLEGLHNHCSFALIVAGDEIKELRTMQAADTTADACMDVAHTSYVGGVDNTPALLRAYDAASQHPDSVILWIHGPQPLKSQSAIDQLMQICERRPGSLRILAFAAADGRNNILAELERTGAVTVVPRRGRVSSDLRELFDSWWGNTNGTLVAVRSRVPLSAVTGKRVSGHIARLWAREEAMRICAVDARKIPEASQLAASYHVVTAVSGAVVLENEEQYKETALKPVDPKNAPSVVPEPATWLVLAAGIGLLATRMRRPR